MPLGCMSQAAWGSVLRTIGVWALAAMVKPFSGAVLRSAGCWAEAEPPSPNDTVPASDSQPPRAARPKNRLFGASNLDITVLLSLSSDYARCAENRCVAPFAAIFSGSVLARGTDYSLRGDPSPSARNACVVYLLLRRTSKDRRNVNLLENNINLGSFSNLPRTLVLKAR